MLQQILRDMYVDPDILAELPEEQKEMLFFKIRQEQIRRYNERENEIEKKNSRRKISPVSKNGGKKVRILEDANGNPWTWVFGDFNGELTAEEKWSRLSAKRMETAIKSMLEEDRTSHISATRKNGTGENMIIIKSKSRSPSSSPPNRSPNLNQRKSSSVVSPVLKRKEANSTWKKTGNVRVPSPPPQGVKYGSSPPSHGVKYGSSPPSHGVKYGSSPPSHGVKYGSSPPSHGVKYGSSPTSLGVKYGSSPPNHNVQHGPKSSSEAKIVKTKVGPTPGNPKPTPQPRLTFNPNTNVTEKLEQKSESIKIPSAQPRKEPQKTAVETLSKMNTDKENVEHLYESLSFESKKEDDSVSNEEWQKQLLRYKEADKRRSIRARRASREFRRQSLLASDPEKLRLRFKHLATTKKRPPLPPKPETLRTKHPAPQPGKQTKPQNRAEVIEWFGNTQLYNLSKTHSPSFPPWLHGIISRAKAEELLQNKQAGDYLIRVSDKIWGYALSYKDVDRIKHFLIDASEEQCYHFFGNDQIRHESLDELILYHENEIMSYDGEKLKNWVGQTDLNNPDYTDLDCEASDTRL